MYMILWVTAFHLLVSIFFFRKMSTEGCLIMAEDSNSCSSSDTGSIPSSPRNRVKFLCSHGGKILPRPIDGQLKYVGGETRVISVPRDIKFSELMKKLTYLIEEETVLKYQLVPQDLDTLVSVKNDEDLRHMFNEHDLYEMSGTPRLRSFLFPAKPVVVENQLETHAIEQRYIDAINGIVRSPNVSMKYHPTLNIFHGPSFGMSSACSSPRSPESCNTDVTTHEPVTHNNFHGSRAHMQRVQSSPSVCNLTGFHQTSPCGHQMYPPNYYHTIRHPPYQGYYSSKPPIDPHKCAGPERLISVRSVGRAEGAGYQVDYVPPLYQAGTLMHSRGSGCCSKCMHSDDYGPIRDRRADRGSSLSPSPVNLSPRYGHIVSKQWDSAVGGDC